MWIEMEKRYGADYIRCVKGDLNRTVRYLNNAMVDLNDLGATKEELQKLEDAKQCIQARLNAAS